MHKKNIFFLTSSKTASAKSKIHGIRMPFIKKVLGVSIENKKERQNRLKTKRKDFGMTSVIPAARAAVEMPFSAASKNRAAIFLQEHIFRNGEEIIVLLGVHDFINGV
jgi:hypothetical protein